MKPLYQLALLAALTGGAALTTWVTKGPPQRAFICDPATLTADEICFDQLRDGPAVTWIDARSRQEWSENGLDGSLLWNLDPAEDQNTFEAQAMPLLLVAERVVIYCGDEQCGTSHEVAKRVRSLETGVEVRVLKGGSRSLQDQGLLTDSNAAR